MMNGVGEEVGRAERGRRNLAQEVGDRSNSLPLAPQKEKNRMADYFQGNSVERLGRR